jgi:vacuolar-type H+-ATPase subunit I/STV1
MDYMFLYPLMGGIVFLSLTAAHKKTVSRSLFRIGFNLYNSGLATLTAGSMLKGIMKIAGTDSEWIPFFTQCGWGFAIIGIIIVLIGYTKHYEG